jgi:5'-methylthioadenosine phosphorylase
VTAPLAIVGGSGVDVRALLDDPDDRTVTTPYGEASATTGRLAGTEVVFLPRHGRGHTDPPHRVNYRANVAALEQLGVERILATAAVGSMRGELRPGTFAIIEDFLDFTRGRDATFHDGGEDGVVHVDVTWPYCEQLRDTLLEVGERESVPVHDGGVYVCVEGPRFETASEIQMFRKLGGDVAGMTGAPEVVLARELGLCYATIAMVTNLAAGLRPEPVSHEEVLEAQAANADALAHLLLAAVPTVPQERACGCDVRPGPVGGTAGGSTGGVGG